MADETNRLKTEVAGMQSEVESLLASYVAVAGWPALLDMLSRIALECDEGRISGVMRGAKQFLFGEGA